MTNTKQEIIDPGAKVYYRDKPIEDEFMDHYMYVEGIVAEVKPVKDAERDWDQDWSQSGGWVLKVLPNVEVEENRAKYRHVSSCLTPAAYRTWVLKQASLYSRLAVRALEDE